MQCWRRPMYAWGAGARWILVIIGSGWVVPPLNLEGDEHGDHKPGPTIFDHVEYWPRRNCLGVTPKRLRKARMKLPLCR